MKRNFIVYAVDFDGTLCESVWPVIGAPNMSLIMCFGWEFSWAIATGIWLIICILKSIFNVTVKKD